MLIGIMEDGGMDRDNICYVVHLQLRDGWSVF